MYGSSPDPTVGIHDLHEIGVKRGHDDAVLPFSEDPVDQLVVDSDITHASCALVSREGAARGEAGRGSIIFAHKVYSWWSKLKGRTSACFYSTRLEMNKKNSSRS